VSTAALEAYYRNHVVVEWHEAGHALVAASFGWQVDRVEVGFARDSGLTWMVRGYTDPWERLCVLVAGRVGERRAPAWDARLAALGAGDDDQAGIADALSELGWRSAEPAEAEVDAILNERPGRLRRVAEALRSRRVLSGAELGELVR
jgi:hypothetical protein